MKIEKYMVRMTCTLTLIGAVLAILFAMPALTHAHAGVTHTTTAESVEHLKETAKDMFGKKASSTVDATCMAEAVEEREDALMSAWGDMSSSTMVALDDRREALVAAWDMEKVSDRARALATAWKEWKADKKAINAEFRKDRKAAWDAFKKTAKEDCKEKLPKEENLEKTASDSIAI
jgi:hypothetical protein